MAVVASPQPNELEQKKKRQTLERAKASHLSKQLQMRLQYAKLKVEHGWQRQNLNEVENLYFHHSIRQGGVGQRPHYAVAAPAPVLAETLAVVQSPSSSGVLDQPVGPGPSPSLDGPESLSSPSQSPSDHPPSADRQLSSPSQACPPLQTPVPPIASSVTTLTDRPPSAFDPSDPNILARLAQLHAQAQIPSHAQTSSRPPSSTTISLSTSTSAPQPISVPVPTSLHIPVPHPTVPPASGTFPLSQPYISTPNPGAVLLYSTSTSTPLNSAIGTSQPPVSTSSAPIPTTQGPIAPTALTYDSFWSAHASSTGSTRALYRTHTGFTASATPAGNVAMLTPGGHAAVMTAEGVYVGGGNNRSG